MLLCFPADEDKGAESVIFEHFAAAAVFVTCDTDTNEYGCIANTGFDRQTGSRNVSDALAEAGVGAVIAGGIGMGAIKRLNGLGIEVFWSATGMVKYDLELYLTGKLAKAEEGRCDGAYR